MKLDNIIFEIRIFDIFYILQIVIVKGVQKISDIIEHEKDPSRCFSASSINNHRGECCSEFVLNVPRCISVSQLKFRHSSYFDINNEDDNSWSSFYLFYFPDYFFLAR